MKKLTLTLFVAFIAIVISSCKKTSTNNPTNTTNPVAEFRISSGTITIGSEFSLINESTNSETYKWEINGILYSTDKDNYYVRLDSAANYIIKLTATDKNGKTNSISKTITVTNQYLKYAGTWDITETDDGGYYETYLSNATVDNKGNITFSNFTFYLTNVKYIPPYLTGSNYFTINNVVINLPDNAKFSSNIEMQESINIQLTGNCYYDYVGSGDDYNSTISGVKR